MPTPPFGIMPQTRIKRPHRPVAIRVEHQHALPRLALITARREQDVVPSIFGETATIPSRPLPPIRRALDASHTLKQPRAVRVFGAGREVWNRRCRGGVGFCGSELWPGRDQGEKDGEVFHRICSLVSVFAQGAFCRWAASCSLLLASSVHRPSSARRRCRSRWRG